MDELPFRISILKNEIVIYDNMVNIIGKKHTHNMSDGIRLEVTTPIKNKILLIDDDIVTLRITERLFQERECRVFSFNSPIDAVNMLDKQEFDLIITDLDMNLINGMEICNIIKERKIQVPIIILTSYNGILDTDLYVVEKKPITKQKVSEIIQKYIKF